LPFCANLGRIGSVQKMIGLIITLISVTGMNRIL
jgi:hypothetical protein